MPLIVEDGSGVANASSYASLGYISDYCSDMGYTSWASLGTTDQTSAVLRAMPFIESRNFKGIKVSYTNSLEFPREGIIDRNGYEVPADEIPSNLMKALAEGSYLESETPGILQPNLERGGQVKFKKIDVLETEWFPGASAETSFLKISGYLKGLIKGRYREVIRS